MSVSDRDLPRTPRAFSQREILDFWRSLVRDERLPEVQDRISLYVHSLLCPTECSYCFCTARQPTRSDERALLMKAILEEAEAFAPVFEEIAFRDVYFGGGTPSLYTVQQFEALLDGVLSRFRIADGAERSIEMNPANVVRQKLVLARDHAFNRVSFGIESLTPSVLMAHGRGYQRTRKVAKALELAHEIGFECINVDLLVLPGETAASWRATVDSVFEMRPSEVHIYRLQVDGYRQRVHGDVASAGKQIPVAEDSVSYREAHAILRECCAKHDFHGVGDYGEDSLTCVARDRSAGDAFQRTYAEEPRDGGSILGLGPGSQSACRYRCRYDNVSTGIADPSFRPRYRGDVRTVEDEARAFLISRIARRQEVARDDFAHRFGRTTWDAIESDLALLAAAGLVRLDGARIVWTMRRPSDALEASLLLAGERAWDSLEILLANGKATTTGGSELEAGSESAPDADGSVPDWIQPGPIGQTRWCVLGRDPQRPAWVRLEGPDGQSVLIQVEAVEDGAEAPVFLRLGGWGISYQGRDLPAQARGVLEALLATAPIDGNVCHQSESPPVQSRSA